MPVSGIKTTTTYENLDGSAVQETWERSIGTDGQGPIFVTKNTLRTIDPYGRRSRITTETIRTPPRISASTLSPYPLVNPFHGSSYPAQHPGSGRHPHPYSGHYTPRMTPYPMPYSHPGYYPPPPVFSNASHDFHGSQQHSSQQFPPRGYANATPKPSRRHSNRTAEDFERLNSRASSSVWSDGEAQQDSEQTLRGLREDRGRILASLGLDLKSSREDIDQKYRSIANLYQTDKETMDRMNEIFDELEDISKKITTIRDEMRKMR